MILLSSIVINIIFLYSIVDMHYRGLKVAPKVECNVKTKPLAKRLVLFISDGLSANQLYRTIGQNKNNSFLRRIMEGEGSWGISEAHVPTMTTTGVMTISTGTIYTSINVFLYNKNTSNYLDNIFNNSNVFYIGCDYALYLLKNSLHHWHITTWKGGFHSTVDKNYIKYDMFVCEHVVKVLQDDKLKTDKDGTIFIVYLPAVDYCGHHIGPTTSYCIEIVKHLDKCIGNLVQHFQNKFKDHMTSFVLTADHGMSDAGEHGLAEPQMKETPILAWGAGMMQKGGKIVKNPTNWKAENLKRIDIKQSDIASFISVILGNPIPSNSYGYIPKDFFNSHDTNLAKSFYCNTKQIYNLLISQGEMPSAIKEHSKATTVLKNTLEKAIRGKNATDIIAIAERLMHLYKEELDLFRLCHKGLILKMMLLLFIGWGLLLLENVLSSLNYKTEKINGVINCVYQKIINGTNLFTWEIFNHFLCDLAFLILGCILCLYIMKNNWPTHFCIYVTALLTVWWRVLKNLKVFSSLFTAFETVRSKYFQILIYSIFTAAIVTSVKYIIYRKLTFLCIALFQIYSLRKTITKRLTIAWLGTSVFFVFFLDSYVSLPPESTKITLPAITWILIITVYIKITGDIWSCVYIFAIIVSEWDATSDLELKDHGYDKKLTHIMISWSLLFVVPLIFLLLPGTGFSRLCHFCFGIGSVFLLFTTREDGLGFFSATLNLMSWYFLELNKSGKCIFSDSDKETKVFSNDDLRRGFIILFYTWGVFFASGFRDYPSSFDFNWAHTFITAFKKYTLIFIIVYKVLVPFFLICFVFSLMYYQLELNKKKTLEWYLFLNNFISAYFIFQVRGEEEENSLKHGYSFARHVLSNVFPMVIVLMVPIMELLVKTKLSLLCMKSFCKRNIQI